LTQSLVNDLCANVADLNQDLLIMGWAYKSGSTFHFSKSIFHHIGTSTSVRGAHFGWQLVDLAFQEIMPLVSIEKDVLL
jgi:hypothetical protein